MATEYYFDASLLLYAQAELSGSWGSFNVANTTIEANADISASFIISLPWTANLEARAEIYSDLTIFEEKAFKNWVAWSKIGTLDFTLDRTNDAGRRPMDWSGWVYQVKQLDKNCIVYGATGITLMYPVAEPFPTFGFKALWSVGLKAKNLLCGNELIHYFVDASGDLCSLDAKGVKVLGYRAELSQLSTHGLAPTMHFDSINHLVYLCDGTVGFTYSESGLGGGPINLTGVQTFEGALISVAPTALSIPSFEACTNILTCGYVEEKTLQKICIATMSPEDFYFAVDYRTDIRKDFSTTSWKKFSKYGEGWIELSFMEMRLKLKSTATNTQIDDIIIHFRAPGVLLEREALK